MSVAARFISGSLAAWSRILVTIGTQIALVPIFLAHWSVEQYGCWLVIQSVSSFVNIFSLAHHNYVGNEMLRVPGQNPQQISALLSAALPLALALGLVELLTVSGVALLGHAEALFDPDGTVSPGLVKEAALSLMLLSGSTFLSVCSSGIYGRVASTFGHFARTAWWGVGIAVLSAVASALLVSGGAGLLTTAAATSALNLLLYTGYQVDLWRLGRRHQIALLHPAWRMGWRNLVASLGLGVSYLLGLVRQQGMRILVSSTLGVAQAVVFTTMRTASNLSLQGIATVVDPVFPEFMGFLRDRKQAAIASTFAFIWLVVTFAMAPMLVLLQAVAPELFALWTHGKVAFDPVVFALFSMTMMVFALARPADSIILGNNLLRVQVVTASSLALLTIGGIVLLNGQFGVRGIALVLLGTELVGASITLFFGFRWLTGQGLGWPRRLFWLATCEVLACGLALLLVALQPAWRGLWVGLTLLVTGALATGFVRQLPPAQIQWLRQRLSRYLPFFRRP